VLELKKRPHVPARLTELLAAIAGKPPLNAHTRILPVPLHPKRERMRGFNQASILAATLSRRIQMPVDEQSLMRTGHSEQYRAGLDYKGRAQTVAGVFQVSQPRLIKGENILLVDDVFTTGATSSSCAEVLIGAGAAEVFVLTIARPGH
jgi:ComF family protein